MKLNRSLGDSFPQFSENKILGSHIYRNPKQKFYEYNISLELNISKEINTKNRNKLLVLDIDETLVFASIGKNSGKFHFSGKVYLLG